MVKPQVRAPLDTAQSDVTLVDLFAGIGGFHYGIGAAAAHLGFGVEPLLVSEIEPSCQSVYLRNHPRAETVLHGDINRLELPRVGRSRTDFVTAGFPCQPFSNSGKKLGLKDPRGRFYSRIEEIILRFRAKVFILENVPGMTKNGGGAFQSELSLTPQKIGKTMHTLERAMKEGLPDYDIQWLEIDSSLLGSPQVRKRVYIVGMHREFGALPDLRISSRGLNPFVRVVDKSAEGNPVLKLNPNQEGNVRRAMRHRTPSYKDGMRRVGTAYTCPGGNVGQAYHAHGLVPTLTKVWARFLPIYFPADGEETPEVGVPDFQPTRGLYGKGQLRRASVKEVMALQGFPTSFRPHERDSAAYEHAGNAVNALVVSELASRLLPITR